MSNLPRRVGRPGKGERTLMSFRVPDDFAAKLFAEYRKADMHISDYVARVMALTHDFPVSQLPAADRLRPDANRSRFDLHPDPDPDLAAAIDELASSVQGSRLSYTEFAAALGIPAGVLSVYLTGRFVCPVNLHRRALRLGASMKRTREEGLTAVFAAGRALCQAVRASDEAWALDACVRTRQDLRRAFAVHPDAVAAWEAIPPTSGTATWDTLLGALIEHEFEAHQREAPRWTRADHLAVPAPWTLPNSSLSPAEVRRQTPRWLAARKIYVSKLDLLER